MDFTTKLFGIGDIEGRANGNSFNVDEGNNLAYYDNAGHNGFFGRNTTSPTVQLDVVGTANISGLINGGTLSGNNSGDQDLSGYSTTSHTHTFASLTSKPTTISGYGITDFNSTGDARYLRISNNLSDVTASTARTNLGLAIGSNVQAYDADLTTYAGITPSTDVQTMLGSANNAAIRSNIGLGTLATQSGTFSGTSSGTNTGDQDLSGYSLLQTTLSGYGMTDAQPPHGDFTMIAGLTATTDNFLIEYLLHGLREHRLKRRQR